MSFLHSALLLDGLRAVQWRLFRYQRSPIFLYLFLSLMFGLLAGILVFPCFRYARMYNDALEYAKEDALGRWVWTPAYCSWSFPIFALSFQTFTPRQLFWASVSHSFMGETLCSGPFGGIRRCHVNVLAKCRVYHMIGMDLCLPRPSESQSSSFIPWECGWPCWLLSSEPPLPEDVCRPISIWLTSKSTIFPRKEGK